MFGVLAFGEVAFSALRDLLASGSVSFTLAAGVTTPLDDLLTDENATLIYTMELYPGPSIEAA